MNKLDTRVAQLENHVRTLYQKNNLLEKVLQELINIMPGPTKQRIDKIIQGQNTQNHVNTPPKIHTPQNTPTPQTPPPPQANPLESIMSMMAPMMSSMIIGGNDDHDIEVASEISEHVSDADISNELKDLEEDRGSDIELDESDRESDKQESDKESNHESDRESDKQESDRESNHESDRESNHESDRESNHESDRESNHESDSSQPKSTA
jgi:hypothetical protein